MFKAYSYMKDRIEMQPKLYRTGEDEKPFINELVDRPCVLGDSSS